MANDKPRGFQDFLDGIVYETKETSTWKQGWEEAKHDTLINADTYKLLYGTGWW